MQRTLIAIGGGEIKSKTTLKIDEYIAGISKERAFPNRATALFIGTASHDSMPYFNSFRKTYTSVFDIKAEVALIVYGEMNIQHIKEKIDKADCIYIGGGDTLFMLEKWKETGLDKLLIQAYKKGKIICGLSAGAICWFTDMYTDYEITKGISSDYSLKKGLGIIGGLFCPHFNEREKDFIPCFLNSEFKTALAAENNSAIVFVNEKIEKSLTSGGKAYLIQKENQGIVKTEI